MDRSSNNSTILTTVPDNASEPSGQPAEDDHADQQHRQRQSRANVDSSALKLKIMLLVLLAVMGGALVG
ncbi:MAG: hypothetical protein MI741_05850, partial [Rhodospirillales bacterium]|nr:hypothetical protein [Rhodospirillales bacterium]